jgi:hypothetical protein
LSDTHPTNAPTWLELEAIRPLRTRRDAPVQDDAAEAVGGGKSIDWSRASAEEITCLSADTLRRRYAKYVVHVSDRRVGMKLKHALMIAAGKAEVGT